MTLPVTAALSKRSGHAHTEARTGAGDPALQRRLDQRTLQQIGSRLTIAEITVRKPPLHEIFIETVKERGETHESA